MRARRRAALCQAVSAGDPFFQVDDRELRRSGPSYTIDTASEFAREGWPAVNWLIGGDQVQVLPRWRRFDELLKQVTFWIARRPGFEIDWNTLPPAMRHLSQQVVTAPLLEISATDIRRRIKAGLSIRYLVPETVERQIVARRLYRD